MIHFFNRELLLLLLIHGQSIREATQKRRRNYPPLWTWSLVSSSKRWPCEWSGCTWNWPGKCHCTADRCSAWEARDLMQAIKHMLKFSSRSFIRIRQVLFQDLEPVRVCITNYRLPNVSIEYLDDDELDNDGLMAWYEFGGFQLWRSEWWILKSGSTLGFGQVITLRNPNCC